MNGVLVNKAIDTIKRRRALFSTVLILLFFGFLGFYIHNNLDDFSSIKIVSAPMLLGLCVSSLINQYGTGRGMDALLRPFNINLSTRETFGLIAITRLLNMTAPGRAGLAFRAGYLKNKYKFPFSVFISTLAAANVLIYLVGAIFGLAALTVMSENSFKTELAVLFSSMIVVIAGLFSFTPRIKKTNTIKSHIARALNGWREIKKDPKVLAGAAFWAIVNVISQAAIIFFAYQTIGFNITVASALIVSISVILSALIAITPGGLGITEGAMFAIASVLGLPGPVTIAAALARRLIGFLISLVTALVSAKSMFEENFDAQYIKRLLLNNKEA